MNHVLSPLELAQFAADGCVVARAVFSPAEVKAFIEHYMQLRATGPLPGDMVADVPVEGDPLLRYPRMIHMHRYDAATRNFLLDARLKNLLVQLLGAEPFAVQSMLYFKPPGARGQALHQDNMYLQASPGTCIAAWTALDACTVENGCMTVVPGSHRWPLLCPTTADGGSSFTNLTVPLPPDVSPVPVLMEPGDVLFFGGSLIHGSSPNLTTDQFRRSLIGHYVEGQTTALTAFDQPVLRMNGEELDLTPSAGGFPCGEWTNLDGAPTLVLTGSLPSLTSTE